MKVKLNFAHPISELDMLNLIATSEMEQMVHDLVIYKMNTSFVQIQEKLCVTTRLFSKC